MIEGYEFDRIAYKVAGSTYRSTDLTHWLALDVAALALADAGFPMAEGLPRERTARRRRQHAHRRVLPRQPAAAALAVRAPHGRRRRSRTQELGRTTSWRRSSTSWRRATRRPFPAIDEDTLAGGLSNTIAGRICNHFDLKGGGYTVDGACSSSLLSVATACKALVDGELDVAVAGGVDLSIDPFEVIGFAKTGALATGEMRVYDRDSNGFWPGEGCGMVVLMREADAARRRPPRLRVDRRLGHLLRRQGRHHPARGRAATSWRCAARTSGPASASRRVGLFEGHGTGTAVGDATELTALSEAPPRGRPDARRPAAIGSIKGDDRPHQGRGRRRRADQGDDGRAPRGAAAGASAASTRTSCSTTSRRAAARAAQGRAVAGRTRRCGPASPRWASAASTPTSCSRRAGAAQRRRGWTAAPGRWPPPRRTSSCCWSTRAARGSCATGCAELTGFAARLAYGAARRPGRHAAPRTARPAVPGGRRGVLARGRRRNGCNGCARRSTPARPRWSPPTAAASSATRSGPGRIGYLFPGQGSGRGTSGGALRRRFADGGGACTAGPRCRPSGDMVATEVAQPRIVTGSIAGLRVLPTLGSRRPSRSGTASARCPRCTGPARSTRTRCCASPRSAARR